MEFGSSSWYWLLQDPRCCWSRVPIPYQFFTDCHRILTSNPARVTNCAADRARLLSWTLAIDQSLFIITKSIILNILTPVVLNLTCTLKATWYLPNASWNTTRDGNSWEKWWTGLPSLGGQLKGSTVACMNLSIAILDSLERGILLTYHPLISN